MDTQSAQNQLSQFDGHTSSPLPNRQEQMTFAVWASRWAEIYKRGQVKANTYYDGILRPLNDHLIPYFGEMQLSDILPIDIMSYFKTLQNTYRLETQHKLKVCLHALFDAALENGLIQQNPVTKSVILRSTIPPIEKHTWNAAQYLTAWNYAKHHPRGLTVMVLLETGLTRSELLGLEWRDFDAVAQTLQIRNGLVPVKNFNNVGSLLHEGLKTKYRNRDIPLSTELTARIQSQPRELWIKGNHAKKIEPILVQPTLIFYSSFGTAWNPNNWYNRCYLPFMENLTRDTELPYLSPHELRHTRSSVLHEKGISLFDIQKLLGHKDLTMLSRRYLHADVEQLRKGLQLS